VQLRTLTDARSFLILTDKRVELVSTHAATNPLHSVFDRIENLPRPALLPLGALHGLQLGQYYGPEHNSWLAEDDAGYVNILISAFLGSSHSLSRM
jgi:hypothetical protein